MIISVITEFSENFERDKFEETPNIIRKNIKPKNRAHRNRSATVTERKTQENQPVTIPTMFVWNGNSSIIKPITGKYSFDKV